jgi:hypothetical protein
MNTGVSVRLTAVLSDPGATAYEAEHFGFESIWSVEHSCIVPHQNSKPNVLMIERAAGWHRGDGSNHLGTSEVRNNFV